MTGGIPMYNEDRKELMDEGYTEAFDACKLIVEKTLNVFLETSKTIDEHTTIQRVVHSIQKQMEEL
jgi:organic radical activating enzyme